MCLITPIILIPIPEHSVAILHQPVESEIIYYPNLITTLSYAYNEANVNLTVTVAPGNAGAAVITSTTMDDLFDENKVIHSQVKSAISDVGVELAPSSVIAGVMATVDATRGVWKGPANVSLRY